MELIGHGIFMWDGIERRTNRYGAFFLARTTYDENVKVDTTFNLEVLRPLLSKRVKVVCIVRESRESGHAGDLFFVPPLLPHQAGGGGAGGSWGR